MQTKRSILQQPKSLPILKNTMRYRKQSSNDDKDENSEGNRAMRQRLPRRCKDIQPFYAIDIAFDDEIYDHVTKKKRGSGPSSRSSLKIKEAQGALGVQVHPRQKPDISMVEKQKDKVEMSIPTILSWLIEMKVVRENTMVKCLNEANKEVIGEGIMTRKGILCYCCKEMFSVSNFPRHRGDHSAHKPYANIFVGETGVSLLTCQIEAWNRHSVPARSGYQHVVRRPRVRDNYDDSCVICADGGDLICCENCPSTYHPNCMGFKGVPQDEWHCPYCHCKYCDQDTSDDLLLTCFQCLKKFHCLDHRQCSEVIEKIPMSLQSPSIPFCGKSCWMVYRKLEEKLGKSMPIGSGLSWTIVRRMDLDIAGQNSEDLYLKANCNSMVVLAAKLMEESFKLIVDRQTRTNMIQSVVYNCGSNFTRTNFSRFYTAVLQFQGQIITVASLRIPSPELTEIPFIATSERWRNKGMCRLLLIAIESALADMGVESIIIPSSDEMVKKWQEKFGFIPLEEAMKREITNLNTLMFPKTTRLQKMISNPKRNMLLHDLNLSPKEQE